MEALLMEIFEQITAKIPNTIVSTYIMRKMPSYCAYWLFRKQFTAQLAASSFQTSTFGIGQRYPHKMLISLATGQVANMDFCPTMPSFHSNEAVPFRLTPNLQEFISTNGIEGLFLGSFVSIATALLSPQKELQDFMCVFVRDEIRQKHAMDHSQILATVEHLLQKIQTLAVALPPLSEKPMQASSTADQTSIDLIAMATHPQKLAMMDCIWAPWL
jgi:transformation/transcription domain-associated protein